MEIIFCTIIEESQNKRRDVFPLPERKQVTRGYNIVADGWAGAYNPLHNPFSHAQTPVGAEMRVSALSNSFITDRLTNRPMDRD